MTEHSRGQSLHWLKKVCYTLAIAVCAVLGVIGLVLPVIPGLVFLFLGVMLLCRISVRVDSLASAHAGFRHMRRRWHSMSLLQARDRALLGFWYCAGLLLKGVETGVQFVTRKIRQ